MIIIFSSIVLFTTVFVSFIPSEYVVYAHKDGCHRWHSCPSDSGSYVCGDMGIDTYCPTRYLDPGLHQVL